MVETNFCPRCGTAVNRGTRFCPRCGYAIATETGVPGEQAMEAGPSADSPAAIPAASSRVRLDAAAEQRLASTPPPKTSPKAWLIGVPVTIFVLGLLTWAVLEGLPFGSREEKLARNGGTPPTPISEGSASTSTLAQIGEPSSIEETRDGRGDAGTNASRDARAAADRANQARPAPPEMARPDLVTKGTPVQPTPDAAGAAAANAAARASEVARANEAARANESARAIAVARASEAARAVAAAQANEAARAMAATRANEASARARAKQNPASPALPPQAPPRPPVAAPVTSNGQLSEGGAIDRLRGFLAGNNPYGVPSSCLDIRSLGFSNRGYTLLVVQSSCDASSEPPHPLGRWRVDTLTREVFRQHSNGRFLRP